MLREICEPLKFRMLPEIYLERLRRTALHSLLFSGGISVSFTYKLYDNHENVRSDTTFDIVHHTYIHGGLSLIHEGSSVAPRTGRTVHDIVRTCTQAQRTRLAALSTSYFFACAMHAHSSSFGHQKVAIPSVPHARQRRRRSPTGRSLRR